MNPSGISDHHLSLKIGAPVMLLRNLQAGPNVSLRNGTRMVVIQMMNRALEVEVAAGINRGLREFKGFHSMTKVETIPSHCFFSLKI
jgi:hypothetical protein